jgi:TusA-related sulfurtransferase
LKAKQALNKMALSQLLHVLASDAGSWRDIHSYLERSPHELLKAAEVEGIYHYWIRRG